MAQSAWGSHPPEVGPASFGWMGPAEISVFCQVKYAFEKSVTAEDNEIFVRGVVSKLPEATDLTFPEAYKRSLFAIFCENYL
jgi:hypothetical protein